MCAVAAISARKLGTRTAPPLKPSTKFVRPRLIFAPILKVEPIGGTEKKTVHLHHAGLSSARARLSLYMARHGRETSNVISSSRLQTTSRACPFLERPAASNATSGNDSANPPPSSRHIHRQSSSSAQACANRVTRPCGSLWDGAQASTVQSR